MGKCCTKSSIEIIELEKDLWVLDNVYDYRTSDSIFKYSQRGEVHVMKQRS